MGKHKKYTREECLNILGQKGWDITFSNNWSSIKRDDLSINMPPIEDLEKWTWVHNAILMEWIRGSLFDRKKTLNIYPRITDRWNPVEKKREVIKVQYSGSLANLNLLRVGGGQHDGGQYLRVRDTPLDAALACSVAYMEAE